MDPTRTRQVAMPARSAVSPAAALGGVMAVAVGLAGCDSPRQVTLRRVAPAADPGCGAPAGALTLHVSARGEFAISGGTERVLLVADQAAVSLADLPADTRSIEVEVRGVGGVVQAAGKTAPLVLGALPDGAQVPVLMAPPGGGCRVGPLMQARVGPLAAATRDGVLIAGGTDADGQPLRTVERYDAATGAIEPLGEPLYGTGPRGLLGASMTAAAGGRVVVAGGPGEAYQVWDPDAGAFGAALFLGEPRAHHAAAALPDGRVLLAGGCGALAADGACEPGTALVTTAIIDPAASTVVAGPALEVPRLGGVALYDGADRVVLVGGADGGGAPVARAEWIDLTGAGPSEVRDVAPAAAAAPLAAGGALIGMSPAEDGALRRAHVLPARSLSGQLAEPVAVTDAVVERDGATLTPLEDGRVLVVGGAADDGDLLVYQPVAAGFRAFVEAGAVAVDPADTAALARRRDHAAVRLSDGSVLVVGGRDTASGDALADAWVVRPGLIGPFAAELAVPFTEPELSRVQFAIPGDPALARQEAAAGGLAYRIESGADGLADPAAPAPSAWAVLAGPEFRAVRITATVRPEVGVAVLLGFRGPDRMHFASLVPDRPAALLRVSGRAVAPVAGCDGATVRADDFEAAGAVPVEVVVAGGAGDAARMRVTAAIAGRQVLVCPGVEGIERGLAGIGVVADRGGVLLVDGLSATR